MGAPEPCGLRSARGSRPISPAPHPWPTAGTAEPHRRRSRVRRCGRQAPRPRPRRQARRPEPSQHSGRRLFAFDRELGARFVAGADEAGRGSLAGPLVAAAVLFDLERLTLADRRALSRLNDSKQHTEAAREELYPLVLRAAASTAIVSRCVRGIDERGLHVTNLDALRSALLRGGARTGTVCLVDGFKVPDVGPRAAGRDRRRLPQRRHRGRIGARQGQPRPLHAPRRRAPPGVGLRRPTSATRRPSTGRRSPSTAFRRCTGCRSSRSPTPSSLPRRLASPPGDAAS